MSDSSRRGFLRKGAQIGSLLGLGALGFESQSAKAQDSLFIEPPPTINRGPIFKRVKPAAALVKAHIPVLQGATSTTETQFKILIEAHRVYEYRIFDPRNATRWVAHPKARHGVATSGALIDHLFVGALEPGREYELEILVDGRLIDRRIFSTYGLRHFSGRPEGEPLRVALISCMNDRYVNDQESMWAAVAKSQPELILFNGDCCYVDQRSDGTIEGMWSRHLTTRRMLDIFRWDRLVPILATWDDHDTGENDSNSSSPRLGPAGEYFSAMFGSDPVHGMQMSEGLSFSYDIGGMRFVLMDCRSGKTRTQVYSQTDERWLQETLEDAPGPVWLVNGTQFFGGYLLGAESVEKTSQSQLARIMAMGAGAGSKHGKKCPLILMSGDVHFSEIMELERDLMGYRSYELTSSSIHSRTFPGQQFRSHNPRRLASTSRYNFMAIEMSTSRANRVEFETVSMGAYEQEFFRLKTMVERT
ncbi:MAG: hypothetical protein RBT63_00755 [Bdellovibrionales bacterium]|nr:hypothetical protein [Bdellovibrionales bacterium]